MLGLVALVGWVVVRFSSTYLAGDPYEQRYAARMLATLAAVSLVVVANHLVVLVAAWAATSLALHGLLTFFGDRPVAVAVAHKKFLLARCRRCLHGRRRRSPSRPRSTRCASTRSPPGRWPPTSLPDRRARIAIALVALAALLKCAQLPFHGWLIQVMEAPTPVSALLHAGVVNLGGFVLLRFAPVVDRAVETRTLLVVVGVTTAVIASLVMTTRVSVKVVARLVDLRPDGIHADAVRPRLVGDGAAPPPRTLALQGSRLPRRRRHRAPDPTPAARTTTSRHRRCAALGDRHRRRRVAGTAAVALAWEALPVTICTVVGGLGAARDRRARARAARRPEARRRAGIGAR